MKQRVRIFVGCEGASERAYVRFLQAQGDIANLHLHFDSFDAKGGDPLSIVEKSLAKLRVEERFKSPFKYKSVILDEDKIGQSPARDEKIAGICRKNGISLILQRWEHESVLLRHFDGFESNMPPKGAGESALQKVWPDYRKPVDSVSLRQKFTTEDLHRALKVEKALADFLRALGFKVSQ